MESSSRFKYIQFITCCRSIHFIKSGSYGLAFSCHLNCVQKFSPGSLNCSAAFCTAHARALLSSPQAGRSPRLDAAPGCPFLRSSYWLSPSFPCPGVFPHLASLLRVSSQLSFILWYITNPWSFFPPHPWLFLLSQQREEKRMKRIRDFLKKERSDGNTGTNVDLSPVL